MWMLVHLMLSQKSLRLSSFLFILFSFSVPQQWIPPYLIFYLFNFCWATVEGRKFCLFCSLLHHQHLGCCMVRSVPSPKLLTWEASVGDTHVYVSADSPVILMGVLWGPHVGPAQPLASQVKNWGPEWHLDFLRSQSMWTACRQPGLGPSPGEASQC